MNVWFKVSPHLFNDTKLLFNRIGFIKCRWEYDVDRQGVQLNKKEEEFLKQKMVSLTPPSLMVSESNKLETGLLVDTI